MPWQPRPAQREQFPARGNATEPILEIASHWEKPNSSDSSSPAPFIFIQQTAQFANFFRRGLAPGQRMHHELARRTFEHSLQHVPGKLPLGLFRGKACFIDVRALGFVSAHGAFCGHNLQKLEHRRVTEIFFLTQRFVDFAHSRRSAVPKDAKNFELRSGGFVRSLLHGKQRTTKMFVLSTTIFVDPKKSDSAQVGNAGASRFHGIPHEGTAESPCELYEKSCKHREESR